jgi:GT2 family glycosyltransferase
MKTLIAIPCFDEMDAGFVQCLVDMKPVGEIRTLVLSGSLIYEARERLADFAIQNGYDHVLWLDSDIMFPSTMLMDMMAQDKDILTGVVAARRHPYYPCVYLSKGEKLEPVKDFDGRIIRVDSCGFGAVLLKTEVLERMFEEFHTCFQPILGYGEDLSFCVRAKKLGYEIYADPNIEIGHIGKTVIHKDTFRRENVSES